MTELSLAELVNIEGGEPNKGTSLGYDISWCVSTVAKWVVDLF